LNKFQSLPLQLVDRREAAPSQRIVEAFVDEVGDGLAFIPHHHRSPGSSYAGIYKQKQPLDYHRAQGVPPLQPPGKPDSSGAKLHRLNQCRMTAADLLTLPDVARRTPELLDYIEQIKPRAEAT
jgi:hypothetical protein